MVENMKKSSKNCTHAYMKIGYSKTCGQNDETEDLFSFESNHGQIYFHFRKVQQTHLNDEGLTDGNGRSSGIRGRAFGDKHFDFSVYLRKIPQDLFE